MPMKGLTQSTILIGHLGEKRNNPDKFALLVMNTILGGSGAMTSRLGETIRSSEGKAYMVWSDFGFGRDEGLFRVITQTAAPNTLWVIRKVQEMLKETAESPRFTKEELERAKKSILRSLVRDYETRFSQVKDLARFRLLDYPSPYLEVFQKEINRVDTGDLERVARQYLHPESLSVLAVVPESDMGVLEKELSSEGGDVEIRKIP